MIRSKVSYVKFVVRVSRERIAKRAEVVLSVGRFKKLIECDRGKCAIDGVSHRSRDIRTRENPFRACHLR